MGKNIIKVSLIALTLFVSMAVIVKAGNAGPLVAASPADIQYYTVNEGEFLTFSENFQWFNPNAEIAIVPLGVPPGAEMPQVSGYSDISSTFKWTPNFCKAGHYVIYVDLTVNGQTEFTDLEDIQVVNVNRPPTVQAPAGPIYVSANSIDPYNVAHFTVSASDPDETECNLPLSESLQTNVQGLSGSPKLTPLGNNQWDFQWPTLPSDSGSHTATFIVTDKHTGQGTANVPINAIYCGDVNHDAYPQPTLQDVIHLVNYIFDKGRTTTGCLGTDPVTCWPITPLEAADAKGDGSVNLADLIYLVNYIFKGGPTLWPLKCGQTQMQPL